MTATAVTILHRPVDPGEFHGWAAALRADGEAAEGFVESIVSIHDDERLDLAVAVTFRTELALNAWLDGESRAAVLADGASRRIHRASSDLVIIEGELTPPGVAVFRQDVAAGKDVEFASAQGGLTSASRQFAGYEGTVVFPQLTGGQWMSLIRFRTQRLLSEWMDSQQRVEALSSLRSTLTRDFSTASHTTPFGTTVRIENGETEFTPNWKSAMLVLMVLYPTVMLLSRFVGPTLDHLGAKPWLALWLSQVVSVSALQWVLMPFAARRMRTWLDPVDGAVLGVNLRGVAFVIGVYVLTLAIFANVTWLQFWDFAD
jgi:antibiotic biosynthesis monooxygenase (ABM) superfamily enzyme